MYYSLGMIIVCPCLKLEWDPLLRSSWLSKPNSVPNTVHISCFLLSFLNHPHLSSHYSCSISESSASPFIYSSSFSYIPKPSSSIPASSGKGLDNQMVAGWDSPPMLMPKRSAQGKQPAIAITLDEHNVPILPSINRNSRSKDLQSGFQDSIMAHHSMPFQVKLTHCQWTENCAIQGWRQRMEKQVCLGNDSAMIGQSS